MVDQRSTFVINSPTMLIWQDWCNGIDTTLLHHLLISDSCFFVMNVSRTSRVSLPTTTIILLLFTYSPVHALEVDAHFFVDLIMIAFCVFSLFLLCFHCHLKRRQRKKFDKLYYNITNSSVRRFSQLLKCYNCENSDCYNCEECPARSGLNMQISFSKTLDMIETQWHLLL